MINKDKYDSIIYKLLQKNDRQKIILGRFSERILKIKTNLNESEEYKFTALKSMINDSAKDIKEILYLIKKLPEQVDVNRHFLVKYIGRTIEDEDK